MGVVVDRHCSRVCVSRVVVGFVVSVAVVVGAGAASADLPQLTWTKLPQRYPVGNIEEAQGGVANGRLYVFGGFDTNGARTGTYAGPLDPLPDAYAFDPANGT